MNKNREVSGVEAYLARLRSGFSFCRLVKRHNAVLKVIKPPISRNPYSTTMGEPWMVSRQKDSVSRYPMAKGVCMTSILGFFFLQ